VFDDVVCAAPVGPRPIQAVQIAGGLEGAHDKGGVGVGRSLWQQRRVRTHERVHLAVTTCSPYSNIYNFIRHIGSHIQYKKQYTANNMMKTVNNSVTNFQQHIRVGHIILAE